MTPRPLVRRGRLLELMVSRVDRSVTLLTATAGFGKSTLIAQMIDDTATADHIHYVTHRVGSTDANGADLERSLKHQIGVLADGRVERDFAGISLADQLWHLSPLYVTVVVDDIHLLAPASPGWGILNDLILDLPENADVVLSGRGHHELKIARLLARGEAVEITEQQLAFTPDEVAAFAELRAVEPSTLDAQGWPALVELEAHTGIAGAHEFVTEEVLANLSADRLSALRSVALHDVIDDGVVHAVTAFEGTAAELLAPIPLTAVAADGTWILHDLLRTVLTRDLDREERRRSLIAGARLMRARGRLRDAIAEAIAADDDTETRDLLAEFARDLPLRRPISDRRNIIEMLPESLEHCAEAELLRADIVVATAPMRAPAPLQLAIEVATEQNRPEVTVLALLRLGDMAYRSGDRSGLERSRDRLGRLDALGGTGADAARVLTEAWLLLLGNDPNGALGLMESEALRSYPPVASMADYYRVVLLGHTGQARASLAALAELRQSPEAAILERRGGFAGLMQWWCGELDADGRRLAVETLDRLGDDQQQHLLVEGAAATALFFASAGDVDEARSLVSRAVAKRDRVPAESWGNITVELALAVISLMDGDEPAAAARLEAVLPPSGPFDGFARHVFGNIGATLYALVPRSRPFFDAESTGDDLRIATEVGRALVALREHSSAGPATRLPWEDLSRLRTWAFEPHLAELAIAAMSSGAIRAGAALTDVRHDPRRVLRDIMQRHRDPVAAFAREELERTPHRPSLVTHVHVLGSTRVGVGLAPDGLTPAIRRTMVRELLLLLVHRGRLRRDEIAALMWPDKDEAAARNNLRATLNHLRTLLESGLEPDATDDGGPPWHVRSEGDSIELFSSDRLLIDAVEFGRTVAAARRADAEGRPADTLTHCLAAIEWYSGPYLADALDPDWAFNERTRYALDMVAMCIRASELLTTRGRADEALVHARRAIELEPLSEPGHRSVARALLALGDRAGARRSLDRCLELLDADGLVPDADTVRLRSGV